MTPDQRCVKRRPPELRERVEEVAGELGEQVRPVLLLGRDATAAVVHRVPAAPEDALILGEPVVVEHVAGVRERLAPAPADRLELLRAERLRHQRVVVDRDDVVAEPLEQRREGVGGEHGAARAQRAPRRAQLDAAAGAREPGRPACARRSARPARGRRAPAPTRGAPGRGWRSRGARARRDRSASGSRRAAPRRRATCAGCRRARAPRAPRAGRPAATGSWRSRARRCAPSRSRCRAPRWCARWRSRFSRPSSARRAFSRGKSSAPWLRPCVSDAMQMPPLRPVA